MIPNILYDKLKKQYDNETLERIVEGYHSKRYVTLRINTIKTTKEEVLEVYELLKKNQYGQYLKDVLDGKYQENLY